MPASTDPWSIHMLIFKQRISIFSVFFMLPRVCALIRFNEAFLISLGLFPWPINAAAGDSGHVLQSGHSLQGHCSLSTKKKAFSRQIRKAWLSMKGLWTPTGGDFFVMLMHPCWMVNLPTVRSGNNFHNCDGLISMFSRLIMRPS